MTMRDILLTLLILVVAVGWFSINGLMEPAQERNVPGWVMQGDGAGKTKLTAPGGGTLAVAVTLAETTPAITEHREETYPTKPAPEIKEETTMHNFDGIVWMVAGAVMFMSGLFAGPLAAALWRKIKNKD